MHTSLRKLTYSGLLVAALTAGASLVYAQEAAQPTEPPAAHHKHAPNPDREAKHLTKVLNLSSDQENQIKPILADQKQQIKALRDDSALAPKDKREKMMSIRQDSKTKLEAVLNDQQKQQFEQMLADRKAHAKGHRHEGPQSTPSPAPQS